MQLYIEDDIMFLRFGVGRINGRYAAKVGGLVEGDLEGRYRTFKSPTLSSGIPKEESVFCQMAG